MKSCFKILALCIGLFYTGINTFSQATRPASIHVSLADTLNHSVIFGLAVKGEVRRALHVLDTAKLSRKEDLQFKEEFEKRFKHAHDETGYLKRTDSTLNPLHRIFQEYWRLGLLDNGQSFDSILQQRLLNFFSRENSNSPFTSGPIADSTLPMAYRRYIESKGYHCTEYGKTGKFYDFIVWKTTVDSTYTIPLIADTVRARVNFLDDFISLGWLEYARLGRYYPGGWATKDELYCVTKGYDIHSEKFKVNFLAHEGQHFLDYKNFPRLASRDMEYRGKLLEVFFGKEELYNRLSYFINNAKYDTLNAHPFANYCIIRDLSQRIFGLDFQKDMDKWKEVPIKRLNEMAKQLYLASTKQLTEAGTNAESVLK